MQQRVDQSGRRTDHHLRDERTIDVADQHAKLGLADTKGVLQDGGEDRLEPAGRARDDAQHLRGRSLLFQCLGKVVPGLGQLAGAGFK